MITKPVVQAAVPAIRVISLLDRLPIKESQIAEKGQVTGDRSRSLISGTNPVTATRQPVEATNKLLASFVQSCPEPGSFIF